MSSDYLRKINKLEKKMNYANKKLEIEVELIIDESNPKYFWSFDDWHEYYMEEKEKGNRVVYLSGKFKEAK